MLEPYGLDYNQAMALFLDDTYEVYWTTSPQELIAKIGRNYSSFWNDINRNKAEALGTTPAEIMTVASITDEETNKLSALRECSSKLVAKLWVPEKSSLAHI